jgi:hypothetical protein
VVPRYPNDLRACQGRELFLRQRVLVGVALVREIAGDDDQVGRGGVDLPDRSVEELLPVPASADMDVRNLRN